MYTTYSFKDLSGAMNDPDVGPFAFAGQIGMGEIIVAMLSERTSQEVAADGTVLVSALPGDNGHLQIQVQQTSQFHNYLLNWYNAKKANYDRNNVVNWAAATVTLRNQLDGSNHTCIGVAPSKIPDKTYAARGAMLTWVLTCADIQNF